MEKWESRGLGEISKGVWEPVKTCSWFSTASMLPPFPRRLGLLSRINVTPSRSNLPTRWGP